MGRQSLADDLERDGVAGLGIGGAPECPPVSRTDRLGDVWAANGLLDRYTGARQRAVGLTLEADLAVGKQLGGVVLAHVVGFDATTRLQAPTFDDVTQREMSLGAADGGVANTRALLCPG